MQLIIIHRNQNALTDDGNNLLRFAISSEPIASVVIKGLSGEFLLNGISSLGWGRSSKVVWVIPEEWGIGSLITTQQLITYTKKGPIYSNLLRKTKRHPWLIISNGRFAAQINTELLNKVLASTKTDVLAVNAEPELLAYREKVQLTVQNKIAGFRRYYSDSVEPAPIPVDWPHYVLIKTAILDRILIEGALPESFSDFLQRCWSVALRLRAVNIAGVTFDLGTEDGLLNFCRTRLPEVGHFLPDETQNSNTISPKSGLVGKVLLGKNVHIDPKAIVVGPTVIGDNVKIKKGVFINSSIIGPDVCVPQNQVLQNCVVKGPQYNWKRLNQFKSNFSKQISYQKFDLNHREHVPKSFRNWPKFSYAGSFKRIADCLAAIIVLILFAPIIPFIVLAIKLTSPGPVLFKDKRQGLHGKEFYCLKFRSMTAGADKMQHKLRAVSEVDGPQFKIADDPRISAVGRFLRSTYIDEIPQFFNVLLGQMSVVGPRPSPESENTLCPFWRDARLSVRPGITGLWQICRTRNPMKDFQEWIYYDTEYVRNLSPRMDLRICWQTVKILIGKFISQF
jgi:lipopolysaccharide/colanic/teichoic acid biosynthesis glycosyltransferase